MSNQINMQNRDKLYFMNLLRNFTSEQLCKFIETVYEEAIDGVEFNKEIGYSSVQFDTWLLKDGEVRQSVWKIYNYILDTY